MYSLEWGKYQQQGGIKRAKIVSSRMRTGKKNVVLKVNVIFFDLKADFLCFSEPFRYAIFIFFINNFCEIRYIISSFLG
jgi:hypothetical protein